MKRMWLAIFWILLLLDGCAVPASPAYTPEDSGPTMEQTTPTDPVGVSSFLSVTAQEEMGLTILDSGLEDLLGFRLWGEYIVIFSGWECTTLTLCHGTTGEILEQLTLPIFLSGEDPTVTVSEDFLTYFDHTAQALIFLDRHLSPVQQIPLDASASAGIALSADQTHLFYCTDTALHSYDLLTGIHRLIAQVTLPYQHLVALHCEDTVIQCNSSNGSLFLDAATGAVLWESPEPVTLWTWEDFYITSHLDGYYPELISGSDHFGPSVLVTDDPALEFVPIAQRHGTLILTYHPENHTTILDYYDLENGTHPYALSLSGQIQPDFLQVESDSVLWFSLWDNNQNAHLLYRWDLSCSVTKDQSQYLQSRFSRAQPDVDGLAECTQLAWEIGRKHDIAIRIYEDAVACQPWDYLLTSEYQVPLIKDCLHRLDEALSAFPPGFLMQAASQTENQQIYLCLVRSIQGIPGGNALPQAQGIQFWDQDANAYVVLTADDFLESHLYHELFHIIDSRVLSTCNAYDDWSKLNPKDFTYTYDYNADWNSAFTDLLYGPDPYFIDAYALTFPKEDRARVMEYAMAEDQGHRFSTPHLQAKLLRLCIGIRKTFSLDPAVAYPWEQYLAEPLV